MHCPQGGHFDRHSPVHKVFQLMGFKPAEVSDATLSTLRTARDRLLEELCRVEAGETRLPAEDLAYLRARIAGLENLIETHERGMS